MFSDKFYFFVLNEYIMQNYKYALIRHAVQVNLLYTWSSAFSLQHGVIFYTVINLCL